VLLDQFSKSEETIKEASEAHEETKKELESMITKNVQLQASIASLTDEVETLEQKNRNNRDQSIGSDGDYGSVQEMKDHLKHARQILIQFI